MPLNSFQTSGNSPGDARQLSPARCRVGILGFVPPDLREEQLAQVRQIKPPFALIAGGRPDHAKSLEAEIRRRLDMIGGRYDLVCDCSGESFLTPPGPLSDLLVKAVAAETGLTPELSTTGGTSDARFIKDFCPVIEFGLAGATMHKVDERVPVADIEALSRIYERILDSYFNAA